MWAAVAMVIVMLVVVGMDFIECTIVFVCLSLERDHAFFRWVEFGHVSTPARYTVSP